jgi:hypothetical protein
LQNFGKHATRRCQTFEKTVKSCKGWEQVAQELKKHPKNQWFYGISLCLLSSYTGVASQAAWGQAEFYMVLGKFFVIITDD